MSRSARAASKQGTVIDFDGTEVTLPHTVLEGHRFVARPVETGEALLSWHTPFARALRDLEVGDYVCTPTSLAAVSARGVEGLPHEPSASNEPLDPYEFDEAALNLGQQVTSVEQPGTFLGYPRAQGPAGTRNHVVLMATSSQSSGFVTELARRFDGADGFDGVVPVAHTEGGEAGTPNNLHVLVGHAGRLRAEPECRRSTDRRHRGRTGVRPGDPGLHDGAGVSADPRAARVLHPAGRIRGTTSPRPGALVEPWLPVVAAHQRARRFPSRTSRSACNAAAPTPSPASPPTRWPARSRAR